MSPPRARCRDWCDRAIAENVGFPLRLGRPAHGSLLAAKTGFDEKDLDEKDLLGFRGSSKETRE
jgi:hypothetical protein